MSNHPSRKPNRLPGYDYTQNGAYSVTICTKDRSPILWNASHFPRNVGDGSPVPQESFLSWIGAIVRQQITEIPVHYPSVTVDRYVILPDHIHLILFLHRDFGTGNPSPTVGNVVGWLKYQTTKTVNAKCGTVGVKMWQRSFYDHVIRDERDYIETMQYIDNNLIRQVHHIPKGM